MTKKTAVPGWMFFEWNLYFTVKSIIEIEMVLLKLFEFSLMPPGTLSLHYVGVSRWKLLKTRKATIGIQDVLTFSPISGKGGGHLRSEALSSPREVTIPILAEGISDLFSITLLDGGGISGLNFKFLLEKSLFILERGGGGISHLKSKISIKASLIG